LALTPKDFRMRYFISALGVAAFAVVSLFHCLALGKIVMFHRPGLAAVAPPLAGLVWAAVVLTFLVQLFRGRLVIAFGGVMIYAAFAVVGGMLVLAGVPARVEEGHWRDPRGLITPETEYVLHNHAVVSKVLSHDEYVLYLM
jgi:hypothetical protein